MVDRPVVVVPVQEHVGMAAREGHVDMTEEEAWGMAGGKTWLQGKHEAEPYEIIVDLIWMPLLILEDLVMPVSPIGHPG